jgi:hypothetical protein
MAEHKKAHPEEEALERYAMNRLAEPALGELEEHLLLCEPCQERLDEVTEYLAVMREATATVAAEVPAEAAWKRWLRLEWLPVPMPAMAGAMVMLVALFVWQPWKAQAPAEWRTVELATLRGDAAGARGVEGFALHLRLDVAGLDIAGATAQLVTAEGEQLTHTPVTMVDGKGELRYAASLPAGQYFVRLKKAGETVREYSLLVERR